MDITTIISVNLAAWMGHNEALGTMKKLSKKSGVGFGTVQRARNGTGNTTIQNLELIANAFKKHAADLLAPSAGEYHTATYSLNHQQAREKEATVLNFENPDADHPAVIEAIALMRAMPDKGKINAVEHLRIVAKEYPSASKANSAR